MCIRDSLQLGLFRSERRHARCYCPELVNRPIRMTELPGLGFRVSQTNSFKKKAGLTVCLHVPLQWLCPKVSRQSDNIHPQKAAELATSNQHFNEICQMCYLGGEAVMEGGQRVATTVWFKRCCCFLLYVTGQTVLRNKSGHAKDKADVKH